jgi:hypothetical protein
MPKSSGRYGWILLAGALAAGLLVGGCSAPGTQPVSIDIERILASEKPEVAGSPPAPKPPKPAGAIVQNIPARPAQAIRDPSRSSPGSVRASLEKQQREALQTLERRLRDYYRLQAEAFELEQNREWEKAEAGLYADANIKIRLAFGDYAEARAPKVVRLAVLVGFPDPNPNSIPPKNPLRPVAQARFDEAKRLREELQRLDDEFMGIVEDILAAVVTQGVGQKEDMLARVKNFRNEMNRRAEVEAQAEVRTSVKELGLQLIEPSPVVVPGAPARRVEIPAETPLPPAPQVPSVGIPRGLADRRKLIQHELTIWLGLNRYRLVKGGHDATEDFQRWRETYRAGL